MHRDCLSLAFLKPNSNSGQVVNNLQGIINDKPLYSILKICRQHLLAVLDLLMVSIIVVLNLQFVHIIVGYNLATPLHEPLLADQVEHARFRRGLHAQGQHAGTSLPFLLAKLTAHLKRLYYQIKRNRVRSPQPKPREREKGLTD